MTIDDLYEEYEFLDFDDRIRMIVDLGAALEPMPDALKTDATRVPGCSSSVWLYPMRGDGGALHFLADSTSGLTKGVVALVLRTVQDRAPDEVLAADIEGTLHRFSLDRHLTSKRTQGIPNMIALIRDTAGRYAGGERAGDASPNS